LRVGFGRVGAIILAKRCFCSVKIKVLGTFVGMQRDDDKGLTAKLLEISNCYFVNE